MQSYLTALDVGPKGLLRDVHTLGLLFESIRIRDLRIYAVAGSRHEYNWLCVPTTSSRATDCP